MTVALCIFCADLHLCDSPPAAREGEPDWQEAMRRQLQDLAFLAQTANGPNTATIPIVCAGDVFDKWGSSAALINFALHELPQMYAVPGQHDLPHHSYKELKSSAFYTLVKAGKVTLLPPNTPVEVIGAVPLRLWGFPWGFDPKPCKKPGDLNIEAAVMHRYVWKNERTCYRGAAEKQRAAALADSLHGYDVAVCGDNHIPFACRVGDCKLYNCGSFYRRHTDEASHRPSVGLLYHDAEQGVSIKRHYLDTSKDVLASKVAAVETDNNVAGAHAFVKALSGLDGETAVDFKAWLLRTLQDTPLHKGVRRAVREALEIAEGK